MRGVSSTIKLWRCTRPSINARQPLRSSIGLAASSKRTFLFSTAERHQSPDSPSLYWPNHDPKWLANRGHFSCEMKRDKFMKPMNIDWSAMIYYSIIVTMAIISSSSQRPFHRPTDQPTGDGLEHVLTLRQLQRQLSDYPLIDCRLGGTYSGGRTVDTFAVVDCFSFLSAGFHKWRFVQIAKALNQSFLSPTEQVHIEIDYRFGGFSSKHSLAAETCQFR